MDKPRELVCCWCEAAQIEGKRTDTGRPLTDEEAAVGFLATHAECRPKLDALFADLATRGVFVEIAGAAPGTEEG